MGHSRDPLDGREDITRTDTVDATRTMWRGEIGDEISNEQNMGLRALSGLDDFGITDGEPDIRGWTVRMTDGVEVGEVDDLIIDTAAMKVRYMCVELDTDASGLDGTRRVLIPLGTARLDDEGDNVFITASASQLRALPQYDDDAFRSDDHADSHAIFGRPWMTGQTASADDNRINTIDSRDMYEQDQYDDREFFGTRRPEREAQSYLRRRVEERHSDTHGAMRRGVDVGTDDELR